MSLENEIGPSIPSYNRVVPGKSMPVFADRITGARYFKLRENQYPKRQEEIAHVLGVGIPYARIIPISQIGDKKARYSTGVEIPDGTRSVDAPAAYKLAAAILAHGLLTNDIDHRLYCSKIDEHTFQINSAHNCGFHEGNGVLFDIEFSQNPWGNIVTARKLRKRLHTLGSHHKKLAEMNLLRAPETLTHAQNMIRGLREAYSGTNGFEYFMKQRNAFRKPEKSGDVRHIAFYKKHIALLQWRLFLKNIDRVLEFLENTPSGS